MNITLLYIVIFGVDNARCWRFLVSFMQILSRYNARTLVVCCETFGISQASESSAKTLGVTAPISKLLSTKTNEPHMLYKLKLAVYIAEHSSTAAVDHVVELVGKFDANSANLTKMRLHRTKCSRLHQAVLAPAFVNELVSDIGDCHFSITVDESTNVANIQCLGIVVRYYSRQLKKVVDTMYRLVALEGATAQQLYDKIVQCFEDDGLSLGRLIGVGCDGASAMIGCNNSVASRLKEQVPGIVVFRCICHSLHLASSKAAAVLVYKSKTVHCV